MEPDGTPYAVKVARTVWSGGKAGDNIKRLPIVINAEKRRVLMSLTRERH
jgi:hypothetical protein